MNNIKRKIKIDWKLICKTQSIFNQKGIKLLINWIKKKSRKYKIFKKYKCHKNQTLILLKAHNKINL